MASKKIKAVRNTHKKDNKQIKTITTKKKKKKKERTNTHKKFFFFFFKHVIK